MSRELRNQFIIRNPVEEPESSVLPVGLSVTGVIPGEQPNDAGEGSIVEDAAEPRGSGLITRRRLIGAGLGAGAVLACPAAVKAVMFAHDRYDRLQTSQKTVDAYLKSKFKSLATNSQLKAGIPYGGRVLQTLSLDTWQTSLGVPGGVPVNSRIAALGTSNTFALGTMDDHTGVLNQPHSIPQIAVNSLSPNVRATLGLGELGVRTEAIPGADSGWGVEGDPRGMYGVRTQLSGKDLHEWLLAAGDDDLVQIRIETFGLDDLRKLAPTIGELSGILSDVFRLATSDTITKDVEHKIDELEIRLGVIAGEFRDNMIAAGDIVAELNRQRRDRGRFSSNGSGAGKRDEHGPSEMVLDFVYTWDIGRQDRIPFSAIDGKNQDALLQRVLKQDQVDPNFPNRYYLDMESIPYGHDIAHWAWVLMFEAQNEAIREIVRRHPEQTIVTEELEDVNRDNKFYWVQLPGGVLIPKGDGHPGLVVDEIGGAQMLAGEFLDIWRRRVVGVGETAVSPYAQYDLQNVA